MSNIEYLASIAEIADAIAVPITLIYLTIQLRQNNKLLQSQFRQAMLETEKFCLKQALEYQELFRNIKQSEKLSEKEQYQLSILFITDMDNRYFEYRQYENGLLTEQEWRARPVIVVGNHGTERGRKWWPTVGQNLYPAEFVEQIDNVLQKEPPMTYIICWYLGREDLGGIQYFAIVLCYMGPVLDGGRSGLATQCCLCRSSS